MGCVFGLGLLRFRGLEPLTSNHTVRGYRAIGRGVCGFSLEFIGGSIGFFDSS